MLEAAFKVDSAIAHAEEFLDTFLKQHLEQEPEKKKTFKEAYIKFLQGWLVDLERRLIGNPRS